MFVRRVHARTAVLVPVLVSHCQCEHDDDDWRARMRGDVRVVHVSTLARRRRRHTRLLVRGHVRGERVSAARRDMQSRRVRRRRRAVRLCIVLLRRRRRHKHERRTHVLRRDAAADASTNGGALARAHT